MFQVNGEKKEKKSKKKGMGQVGGWQPFPLPHGITPKQQYPVPCDSVPRVPPQPPPAAMRRTILTPAPNPSGPRRRKTRHPSSRLVGTPPRRRKAKRKVRARHR